MDILQLKRRYEMGSMYPVDKTEKERAEASARKAAALVVFVIICFVVYYNWVNRNVTDDLLNQSRTPPTKTVVEDMKNTTALDKAAIKFAREKIQRDWGRDYEGAEEKRVDFEEMEASEDKGVLFLYPSLETPAFRTEAKLPPNIKLRQSEDKHSLVLSRDDKTIVVVMVGKVDLRLLAKKRYYRWYAVTCFQDESGVWTTKEAAMFPQTGSVPPEFTRLEHMLKKL